MNKSQLLADIETKVLKVVQTIEEPDEVKNAAGVKMYITHVMEQQGDKVHGRNIGWYTVDEGTAQEEAFYRDQPQRKNAARDAVVTYLDSKVADGTFLRYDKSTVQVNEENRSGTVNVVINNGDGTATERRAFLYKNGANPISHLLLTA